jgi:hypothetical protein
MKDIFLLELFLQLGCFLLLLSHWLPSLTWRMFLVRRSGRWSWLWSPQVLVFVETLRITQRQKDVGWLQFNYGWSPIGADLVSELYAERPSRYEPRSDTSTTKRKTGSTGDGKSSSRRKG